MKTLLLTISTALIYIFIAFIYVIVFSVIYPNNEVLQLIANSMYIIKFSLICAFLGLLGWFTLLKVV